MLCRPRWSSGSYIPLTGDELHHCHVLYHLLLIYIYKLHWNLPLNHLPWVLQTINSLRRKDPSIYHPQANFFDGSSEEDEEAETQPAETQPASEEEEAETREDFLERKKSKGIHPATTEKKVKAKKYKDVLREQLLRDGAGEDSEEDSHRGQSLLIYIRIFHVLNDLLLIYICKLHWNRNTMFVCQVIPF
jgi:mRNA-degrading endonuclease YafQ of YafQ-DinJ toxin-antitoxin module